MSLAYLLNLLLYIFGLGLFIFLLIFALLSIREREARTAQRALLLAVLCPLPYFLIALCQFPLKQLIAAILVIASVLTTLFLVTPLRKKTPAEDDKPSKRIDERDTMFSRNELHITSHFEEYYARNPNKRSTDDKFRANPGLLGKRSAYYHPVTFAAAQASFSAVKSFHRNLDKKPTRKNLICIDEKEISTFIKKWGKKLGAVSVGIAKLQDYHLYSHAGRGASYGKPVDVKHQFAIALTVEMDKTMLDWAPYGPTVMESAQQYLSSGAIAVQIAEFIRNLGYPARAHIDGNYRVVCPLVARDAGLGEIGRMGLLMTPELGPRVRIAVVTTDMPLLTDQRKSDPSIGDFCRRCKKCAEVCPSKAIPFGDRVEIDGVRRWQINSEACFTHWTLVGTDCGRCVAVCPYSHPNNLLHNAVRSCVRNSWIFGKFALALDDFFYGRKPPPRKPLGWMNRNTIILG